MSDEQDDLLNSEVNKQTTAEPETVQNLIEQTQIEAQLSVAVPAQEEIDEHILLAEQFDNYLRIAKSLMSTLRRPKDIEICSNLMRKVELLSDSRHLEVKRNNNRFFRYCLKVLNWTSIHQPMEFYQCWHRNQDDAAVPITESRNWSEVDKSYLAIKSLKDGTIILYAAISDNPEAGWQDGGLNTLAKQGACQRN